MIRLALLLMLLAGSARASDLKVATWNLEWLTLRPAGDPALPANVEPKRPENIDALRRYGRMLDADVVAFQEVDGPEAAAAVFPRDRYALFMTRDNMVQRVGFAVRLGIPVWQNPDLTGLDVYPDAHYHLRSGADITINLPGGRLRMLSVHLKSGCNADRLRGGSRVCDTLRLQVVPLQGWIAQRRDEGVPFVLIGDFNRRMDGREEVWSALNGTAPLSRATEGRATPCWGGNAFIDHIIAGGAARGWMQADTLRVMLYREPETAKATLSDHCPVSVRFRLPD